MGKQKMTTEFRWRKPLGRERTLKDNIRMDLREADIEHKMWMDLAQYPVQWQLCY
jgi:hypothetical protein